MCYALGIGVMLSVKVLCSLYRWNAIDLYMRHDKRKVRRTCYMIEHETGYKMEHESWHKNEHETCYMEVNT